MSAPPYMKLFWGDYHKATRHLNRDQHGAYFLLIGEAWRLGGALPDDDAILAAWALCTADEWHSMKATIMAFFSLRRGKWVHDRVREELAHYETISRKRKSAGRLGGSATSGKDRVNPEANAKQKPTKPEPEPEPSIEPIGSISSPPQKLAGRQAKFEQFWRAYPSRVGKGAAQKAFSRALDRIGGEDPLAVILGAVTRSQRSERWREGFVPNPATWLNQDRWEDELPGEASEESQEAKIAQWGPKQWRLAVELFAEEGRWFDACGPRPGEPGCRAPPEALAILTPPEVGAVVPFPVERRASA